MNFRNTLGAVAGFALLASAPLAVAQDDAQTTRYYWDLTDIFPSEQAWEEARLAVEARVEAHWRTGVEMEALTAASVAALTIYDMCKAMDRGMVVKEVLLLSKSGGKSGDWTRSA